MEVINIVQLDIDSVILDKIVRIVREADVLVASPSVIEDAYSLKDCVSAQEIFGCELKVLVDNNILTRVLPLVDSESLDQYDSSNESNKIACAVMCFLILGDFIIEPSMAIYEKASHSGHESVLSELLNFRIADHLHPQVYAALALGYKDRLDKSLIDSAKKDAMLTLKEPKESNFAKSLTDWKINYLFILKCAYLWKAEQNKFEAAKKFIMWMESETYFSAVAGLFSLVFFSPKRLSKMLKGIESESSDKLIKGLKNCAWDMTYVSRWGKVSQDADEKTIWFLCTNDKMVRGIAKFLFVKDGADSKESLTELFSEFWGVDLGRKLSDIYSDAVSQVKLSPEGRDTRIHERFHSLDRMIVELESELGIRT